MRIPPLSPYGEQSKKKLDSNDRAEEADFGEALHAIQSSYLPAPRALAQKLSQFLKAMVGR